MFIFSLLCGTLKGNEVKLCNFKEARCVALVVVQWSFVQFFDVLKKLTSTVQSVFEIHCDEVVEVLPIISLAS